MTQLINAKFNTIKVKSYDVLALDNKTLYKVSYSPISKDDIHETALKLHEHIEIIAESRKLIQEGDTMSSDDFLNV